MTHRGASKVSLPLRSVLTVTDSLYLVDSVGIRKGVEFGVEPVQHVRNLESKPQTYHDKCIIFHNHLRVNL